MTFSFGFVPGDTAAILRFLSNTMVPFYVVVLLFALTIRSQDAVPTIMQKNVSSVMDNNPIYFPGSLMTHSPQGNTIRVNGSQNSVSTNNVSSDVTNLTHRRESGGKVEGVVSNIGNNMRSNSTNGNFTNNFNASTNSSDEEVDIKPYFIIDAPVRPNDDDHGCSEGQKWSFGHCREILD